MLRKLKVKDVAKLMGKDEMFVRIGLQRGLLPFGTAIKTSSKYSYYINPVQVEEYLGINLNEEMCTLLDNDDNINS